jgi:hypothetical protein
VHREPASDVGHRILLRAHRHAVGQGGHFPDYVVDVAAFLSGLAGTDEPRVLGEPTSVEEQRDAEAVADLPDAAQVLERNRLFFYS